MKRPLLFAFISFIVMFILMVITFFIAYLPVWILGASDTFGVLIMFGAWYGLGIGAYVLKKKKKEQDKLLGNWEWYRANPELFLEYKADKERREKLLEKWKLFIEDPLLLFIYTADEERPDKNRDNKLPIPAVSVSLEVGHWSGTFDEIWKKGSADSAGGWDLNCTIHNRGNRTISNVIIDVSPYDETGAKAGETMSLEFACQLEDDEAEDFKSLNNWYDASINIVAIDEIKVIFSDGTWQRIVNDEVVY